MISPAAWRSTASTRPRRRAPEEDRVHGEQLRARRAPSANLYNDGGAGPSPLTDPSSDQRRATGKFTELSVSGLQHFRADRSRAGAASPSPATRSPRPWRSTRSHAHAPRKQDRRTSGTTSDLPWIPPRACSRRSGSTRTRSSRSTWRRPGCGASGSATERLGVSPAEAPDRLDQRAELRLLLVRAGKVEAEARPFVMNASSTRSSRPSEEVALDAAWSGT